MLELLQETLCYLENHNKCHVCFHHLSANDAKRLRHLQIKLAVGILDELNKTQTHQEKLVKCNANVIIPEIIEVKEEICEENLSFPWSRNLTEILHGDASNENVFKESHEDILIKNEMKFGKSDIRSNSQMQQVTDGSHKEEDFQDVVEEVKSEIDNEIILMPVDKNIQNEANGKIIRATSVDGNGCGKIELNNDRAEVKHVNNLVENDHTVETDKVIPDEDDSGSGDDASIDETDDGDDETDDGDDDGSFSDDEDWIPSEMDFGKGPYDCDECEESFPFKTALEKHFQSKHGTEYIFKCPKCCKAFVSSHFLKVHILSDGCGKVTCEICGKQLLKQSLNAHKILHRKPKSMVQCDLCDKTFQNQSSLTSHIKHVHDKERHTCEICGISYVLKRSLEAHMYTHAGNLPFQCDICAKQFTKKYNLNLHIRTHSTAKRYTCKICGKQFKSGLSRHVATHTRKECDICGKKFSNMPKHRKIHFKLQSNKTTS